MKFKKPNRNSDTRALTFADKDGDNLSLLVFHRDFACHYAILQLNSRDGDDSVAIGFTRKKLRALANKILKELDR